MKNARLKFIFPLLALTALLVSCKKDAEDPNEEELITTVRLTFTEVGGGGSALNYTFRDLDGDGGAAPSVYEDIILAPGKTYNMSITLLNEAVSPADDITAEVSAEGEDHQFYFSPLGVNVTITNLNTDAGGLPLGLTSTWTTGAASNGTVKIVLKHKPGIKATGDPVTKGDTDIELDWIVRVQ